MDIPDLAIASYRDNICENSAIFSSGGAGISPFAVIGIPACTA
jgi:hypothetical protein